jgi:hypothetical protein
LSKEDQDAFGKVMAQLIKTKKADKDIAGLGEVFGTMFASERKRHSKSFVYALMAVQTMAVEGGGSGAEMLSPKQGAGGGAFPPAFEGAVQGQQGTKQFTKGALEKDKEYDKEAGQKQVDKWSEKTKENQQKSLDNWKNDPKRKPGDKPPKYFGHDPDKTVQEAYRREVEQIRRWAKAAGLDEEVFKDKKTVADIVEIIEGALAKFYATKGS